MNTIKAIQYLAKNLSTPYFGADRGWVYQDYLWGELADLEAGFHTTRQKLDIVTGVIPPEATTIVDIGCANGALSIGLSLEGYVVTGKDINQSHIQIAALATDYLAQHGWYGADLYRPAWQQEDALSKSGPMWPYDVSISLSVWKWLVIQSGMERANRWIKDVYGHTDKLLLIELGIADSGMDMGVDMTRQATPSYIEKCLGQEVFLAGVIEDKEHHMERDVWGCKR